MRRLADAFAVFVYGSLIALAIGFLVIPILVSIILSFDARSFIGPFPPADFSLRWYEEFLANDTYHKGLRTSLLVSGIATVVSTALGTLAALALDRGRFAGRDLLQALFLSPLVIPTVVIGFGVLIFAARIGVIDGLPRLIMGHILITFPYVLRTVLAVISGIPKSYLEAALSLGARPWPATLSVTLPLARSGIVAGAIFAFVMSFDEVAVSLFLSDAFTYTLPVALLAQMRANLNLTVAAVSVIFLVATILLIVLLDRFAGIDSLFGRASHAR